MSTHRILVATALLCAATWSQAAIDGPQLARIQASVQDFVRTQSAGLPGKVSATLGGIDTRLSLTPCPAPETFLPPGARLWGNATLGVRCNGQQPWTIYVPVAIKIMAPVVVAAHPVPQGRVIELADLLLREADLGQLPAAVVTEPTQAVGRIASIGIAPGQPLRLDLLRAPLVLQQGQSVTLQIEGVGFRIGATGKAVSKAAEGQVVQVRLPSGQSINGIARFGGVVEVR